jgi:hypothetical protein
MKSYMNRHTSRCAKGVQRANLPPEKALVQWAHLHCIFAPSVNFNLRFHLHHCLWTLVTLEGEQRRSVVVSDHSLSVLVPWVSIACPSRRSVGEEPRSGIAAQSLLHLLIWPA